MKKKNSSKKMSPATEFIYKKYKEIVKTFDETNHPFLAEGYSVINMKFWDADITPVFTRRVEALEALLFSFIEHCHDDAALDRLQTSLLPNYKEEDDGMVH